MWSKHELGPSVSSSPVHQPVAPLGGLVRGGQVHKYGGLSHKQDWLKTSCSNEPKPERRLAREERGLAVGMSLPRKTGYQGSLQHTSQTLPCAPDGPEDQLCPPPGCGTLRGSECGLGKAGQEEPGLPMPCICERDRFHPNTQIFSIQICGSVFWHLSKQSFRGCFSSLVLYTHICTHTQTPALKSAVIVSELETHPAFDLNFPALQDAGILTP